MFKCDLDLAITGRYRRRNSKCHGTYSSKDGNLFSLRCRVSGIDGLERTKRPHSGLDSRETDSFAESRIIREDAS